MDQYESRIAQLERSSRRDRTIALGVLAIALATAQAPRNSPPATPALTPVVVRDAGGTSATLSARGLTVRDAAGKERVFCGLDSSGRPSLDLDDQSGQLRESLYLFDKGYPTLRQFDANGKRRSELRLDSDDSGELLLNDENERLRLALFRTTTGDPEIGLYGTDEKLRSYWATDNDSPYFVMRDAPGATRVYLGGYKDGKIGLDIRDASNVTIWKAP